MSEHSSIVFGVRDFLRICSPKKCMCELLHRSLDDDFAADCCVRCRNKPSEGVKRKSKNRQSITVENKSFQSGVPILEVQILKCWIKLHAWKFEVSVRGLLEYIVGGCLGIRAFCVLLDVISAAAPRGLTRRWPPVQWGMDHATGLKS